MELGLLKRLSRRELTTAVSLYADDVVIFGHPDEADLRAVRGILEVFGEASGMRTNFAKCSVSPIACTEEVAAGATAIMECQLAPFPVKYLGISLAIRRLTADAVQPMVDRIGDKLPTWKASMMPKARRLTLIRSVLAAIPLHQLMVLSLNKKALKQVYKIFRGFLWVGRKEVNGGHCHVNWDRVCRPLCYSGLGIPDLAHTAISLRTHWVWRMRTDPLRPWRGLDIQFSRSERDIFFASTVMVVGDGSSALFWEDRWLDGKSVGEVAPDLLALIPRHPRKHRTVEQALTERSWITDIMGAVSPLALWQYVQLWSRVQRVQLMDVPNKLVWRWTTDGQVFFQVLLLHPLPRVVSVRVLGVELEILGATQGEVLHLACLPRQVLDG
ncbi:uncharacterized protein [Lolium perenne]|uniref:uncharacterized protein n=1 Tax=Lolium perenne TaxID=4522 RepID=UPI003A9A52E6